MKKAIVLVFALVFILAGVASAASYEAHVTDVRVHVENAMAITSGPETDLGTLFPELQVEHSVNIGLTNSFLTSDYSTVRYLVYWEPKTDEEITFCPIGPYMTFTPSANEWLFDGDLSHLPAGFPSTSVRIPPGGSLVGGGTLYWNTPGVPCDSWHFIFKAPVFDKWYNPDTDPITSGVVVMGPQTSTQCGYYLVTETICGQQVQVPHVDLGGNLKFQVIDIVLHR
jgi:hypothetical protein